jgi:hypothetical protein
MITLNEKVASISKEIAINEWQNMMFYIARDRLWLFLHGHAFIIPDGFPLGSFGIADCFVIVGKNVMERIRSVRKVAQHCNEQVLIELSRREYSRNESGFPNGD